MSLTIAPSPFGSLVVSVAETGSTLSVTTVATSPSVLTMALGVPGPTGATGSQGPAGTNGTNGVGVAAGGTTGQALVKLSGTNYDTGWASINSAAWGNITGTLSSQTDLQNALNAKLSTSAAASTYLPLTGGTLSAGLLVNAGDYSYDLGDAGLIIGTLTAGIGLNFNGEGLILSGSGNAITFPDSTIQTTAFPPTGGLVTEYITGTGTLVTFPEVGDRYLTSSTSTLTCDSGNGKTMTVGTGLSYSRQQDITVSYSNSVHMHGTVLTYDSATGVMTFDANTHSGSGTFSNWEVNVGGVAGAILPVGGTSGQVLAKINSTNFNTEWVSLGTMSTEPATAYLSTASAVANYQTISGMSDYLSTASASANFIGTSAYATTAQAQAGTSTTTVVNPATLLDAKYFAGYKPLSMVYTWTSSVSGAGASTTVSGQTKNVFGPTTAIGSAIAYIFNYNSSRGQQSASGADFTKRTTIGGRFIKTTTTADANTAFRFLLGKSIPSPAAGDLSVRGIGFRQVANGALELQVHNGTTLYNVTSSFTPTANQSYDVVIVADAGTATMFVNGSSVATSANAPTALLGTNTGILEVETQNTAIITGSALNYSSSDMFVQTNL